MRQTAKIDSLEDARAVDTKTLQGILCCGHDTAVKIGTTARARIQIGRRVLWNVRKVQSYLDSISE